MPLAVKHRQLLWHIVLFSMEIFPTLTTVDCMLDVFIINTASTILPSPMLLVNLLLHFITLPMYVGMRGMTMTVGMIHPLQSAQTPLKQHQSFLLLLYSEYLQLVHTAKLKSVFLGLMRLFLFLPLYIPMRLSF